MTYSIKTRKDYSGAWRATSAAVLGDTAEGTRTLELTTYKVRGGITAYASVFIYKPDGSKQTMIGGDFTKGNIALTPCKRVTEKAIIQVHKMALLKMENIIAEATAFYSDQD